MIPTKPIIPRKETQTAVIIEASSIDAKRSRSTATPISRRITAQKGVELPAHNEEKHKASQYDDSHNEIRTIGCPTQISECPDHSGRKAYVGGIELQDGCRRSPY